MRLRYGCARGLIWPWLRCHRLAQLALTSALLDCCAVCHGDSLTRLAGRPGCHGLPSSSAASSTASRRSCLLLGRRYRAVRVTHRVVSCRGCARVWHCAGGLVLRSLGSAGAVAGALPNCSSGRCRCAAGTASAAAATPARPANPTDCRAALQRGSACCSCSYSRGADGRRRRGDGPRGAHVAYFSRGPNSSCRPLWQSWRHMPGQAAAASQCLGLQGRVARAAGGGLTGWEVRRQHAARGGLDLLQPREGRGGDGQEAHHVAAADLRRGGGRRGGREGAPGCVEGRGR
jgi:hypothetical protein